MAVIIENPTRASIRNALAIFGSVRKPTLVKFTELINTTKTSSAQLVKMETGMPPHRKVISPFDQIINNSSYDNTNFAGANAFEAYVAMLSENEQAVDEFTDVLVSKAKYPYHYVATIGDTTNLILVFDSTGSRRIAHHNRAADLGEDEVLIFVVPPGYKPEDISSVRIIGNYRIAMMNTSVPSKPVCALSDIIKGV